MQPVVATVRKLIGHDCAMISWSLISLLNIALNSRSHYTCCVYNFVICSWHFCRRSIPGHLVFSLGLIGM